MPESEAAAEFVPGTSVPRSIRDLPVQTATQSLVTALPFHSIDLRALQEADALLAEILPFWRRKTRPTMDEKRSLSNGALALLRQWDRLVERDGILHRRVFCQNGKEEA